MRQHKYRKGEKYTMLNLLLIDIFDFEKYIYWNHRPLHPAFVQQMSLKVIIKALEDGVLWEAIPNA